MNIYLQLSPEDVPAWYDACTLDERECHLKSVLSGCDLERWHSELHPDDQTRLVRAMEARQVKVSRETALLLLSEEVYSSPQ